MGSEEIKKPSILHLFYGKGELQFYYFFPRVISVVLPELHIPYDNTELENEVVH